MNMKFLFLFFFLDKDCISLIFIQIRQQKDVLANNSFYFLASYISIYSGYGPSQAGIKR